MEQNMLCHFFFFSLFATEFKRLYITGTESIDRNKQKEERNRRAAIERKQEDVKRKEKERTREIETLYTSKGIYLATSQ